jgi:hypothetical protein
MPFLTAERRARSALRAAVENVGFEMMLAMINDVVAAERLQ